MVATAMYLLDEVRLIEEHLSDGSYTRWYSGHLENSVYKPVIAKTLEMLDRS